MTITLTTNGAPASGEAALASARATVLEGNGLPGRWQGREAFVILEAGFGAGLGLLAAWAAMRAEPGRPKRLHYIALEPQPATRDALRAAHAEHAGFDALTGALATAWPPPLSGFHRLHFDGGQVILTLLFGDVRASLAQLEARVDAFAAGPATPAGLWTPESVREFARLAAPGATLATRATEGGVKAALVGAGFEVTSRGDPVDLLTCRFRGGEAASPPVREAIVVGAGLAGTLCAERLASRGWEVALVDARLEREAGAVGLVRPIANLRDATNARISRSAFLYALQHFRALQVEGYHLVWERSGILQQAGDDDEAARMKAIAEGYPEEFLAFVDAAQAASAAGRPVPRPGWWYASGAWVSLPSLAIASLARAGERVSKKLGHRVERIERDGHVWRALDAAGGVIAQAPAIVLANATDAARLMPDARMALSSVRGQLTYLPADPARALGCVVSGNGYVAPRPEGGHCIGATYRHDDDDPNVRAADHRENLEHAESLLPGFTAGTHPPSLAGWTGFRATVPDRLPIFGACLAPGAYAATGLGSRGLLWAPLGAELIACALEGEPSPLPRDQRGAISPRRFLS